jgi:hypothetical protein
MDDIDRAQAREAQIRDDAIAEFRRRAYTSLKPVGACHYCGETLQDGALFCDVHCRGDWEHEQRLRRIAGKAAA